MTKIDLSSAIILPVHRPDTKIIRNQAVAAAKRGEPRSECIHPMHAITQFVDEEPGREDRPTNLFTCQQCGNHLFIVDAHGVPAADG